MYYGYYVDFGYMGYFKGRYILFATKSEYCEYVKTHIIFE